MMAIVDDIKRLREETSCGVIDCKKALEESKGDFNKAKDLLRQRGLELALKKADRKASEGKIEGYVHNGKIGVLVEVNCETDFVARSDDFNIFAKDVAMHIAAMAPKYLRREDIPADILEKEANKDAFAKENCLLEQPFVKDAGKTIADLLNELVAKIRENIQIGRFIRFKVGE